MAYSYRRDLTAKEQLPAVGAAVAAGAAVAVAVFYVARIFLARTPLLTAEPTPPEALPRGGRAAAQLRPGAGRSG